MHVDAEAIPSHESNVDDDDDDCNDKGLGGSKGAANAAPPPPPRASHQLMTRATTPVMPNEILEKEP